MTSTHRKSPDALTASGESRSQSRVPSVGNARASLGVCLRRTFVPVIAIACGAAVATYAAVPGESQLAATLGIAAGFLASLVALGIEARALCATPGSPQGGSPRVEGGARGDAPAGDRAAGLRFQVAMALGFAVLFVSLCGSVLALYLAGVKFVNWSAFALAFAGSAFVLHVAGVLVLIRTRNQPTPTATSACRAA